MEPLDIRILEILQEDCTQSPSQIGATIGAPAEEVGARIKRLEDEGIIRKYVALLDARKLGKDILAFIGVNIGHPRNIEHFEAQIESFKEVAECHHVTGQFTLVLKVRTRNTDSLEKLIRGIRSIEGVTSTYTMVVFSTSREEMRVSLRD
ncbi:MAG: Lrp/AsnC family transcriptional regulator [Nitrospinota bacterium]